MKFLDEENKDFFAGTGVNAENLVETVADFAAWHEENPDKQLTTFFKRKSNIDARTLRVLALIGLKVILDEVAEMGTEYEKHCSEMEEERSDE